MFQVGTQAKASLFRLEVSGLRGWRRKQTHTLSVLSHQQTRGPPRPWDPEQEQPLLTA